MGIIAVADVIKEDSPKAVLELKNMGVHVVMLTGDNDVQQRLSADRQASMKSLPVFCLMEKKK